MAREHHVGLFHARLVKERVKSLDTSLFRRHESDIAGWLGMLQRGDLNQINEVKLHGEFLRGVFGDVLGYTTAARSKDGHFELDAERKIAGGSADGAIGFFTARGGQVVAPIELKGASQFLEHAKGRSLTPIQQGWDYANKTPESRWIIVSNYQETRLYAKSRGQGAYELFRLEELATQDGFLRFVALLGRDAVLGGPTVDKSPLAEMLVASEKTEREITERLYAKYRDIRVRLFGELCRHHSNIPSDTLLEYAQTILDRVLFLAFAEDRQLIPPNTLAQAYAYRDPYNPRPVWHNFLAVFRSIDKGNPLLGIPLYNGGLFRELAELADLDVSDESCNAFKELGEYDFADDVSVEVLGHIFEQSIADLEQLRRDATVGAASASTPPLPTTGTQKAPSKRKKEGIFYTPPFITSYIVRQTLGQTIADAWERSGAGRAENKRDRIEGWESYRSQLRLIRVLDPACGSGAFLIAAFDALAQEFARVNRALAELRGQREQTSLFDLTRTVLNENLFGIDKSVESVEITKLSLWLKTAERGKKLTFLDRNIRHGNSVVSDPTVDPWAFDWKAGQVARSFMEVEVPAGEDADVIASRWRDGFDVVIGNPPYVRSELLTDYKEHWRSSFQLFDGVADLFVYFFERGLQQLKTGGRLGFIVSNKWLRSGYAQELRKYLAGKCTVESVVDFGHAPIFPDADAFPCIITLRKTKPAPGHAVRVTLYPREKLGEELIASYVDKHVFALPQNSLSHIGWTLEPPEVQGLLAKMQASASPLLAYTGVKLYYGIKTGFNEAFLIDEQTKERLCRQCPRSVEVLKKYLRGQDIGRWSAQWANLWLLLIKSSDNQNWPWSDFRNEHDAEEKFKQCYPAVYEHLKPFESILRKRSDQGRYWWELRSCAYYELFEQSNILVHRYMFHSSFALSKPGMYINDASAFIPSGDPWLVAVLNSPAFWVYAFKKFPHKKDETIAMDQTVLSAAPIPAPRDDMRVLASKAVADVQQRTHMINEVLSGVLDVLRIEFDVESPGNALSDFASLDSDGFVREVKKRRGAKGSTLSPAGLRALRELYSTQTPPVLAARAAILEHERRLADAVHVAYGLTPADLAIFRESKPPRMPPGW